MTQNKEENEKHGLARVVIPAVIVAAASILSGYFSYSAGIRAVQIPLEATQTAEARQANQTQSTQPVSIPAGQIGTQVVQVTPTMDMQVAPIESLPLYVAAYKSNDNPTNPEEGFARMTVRYDAEGGTGYTIDYSLPGSGEGNAGIAFKFSEPYDLLGYDLADYKFMEVSINFGDDQASCELFMKDITDRTDAILLDSTAANLDPQSGVIRIVLSDVYDAVNLKVVKEIGCNAKAALSRGQHVFTIRRIRFIKE